MKTGEGKRFNLWKCLGWFVVSWIVLFIAAFLAFGWWAGKELDNAERRWADAGLAKSFGDLVTAPVPDDENFAAQVPLKGLGNPGSVAAELEGSWGPISCDGKQELGPLELLAGRSIDLEAWVGALVECGQLAPLESASAAEALVIVTEPVARIVEQLAPGLDRKSSIIVPGWEQHVDRPMRFDVDLNYLSVMQNLARAMALRSAALLEAGEIEEAVLTLEVAWRAMGALENGPIVMDDLVLVTSTGVLNDAVWAGLKMRAFDVAQLRRLEGVLGRINLRGTLVASLEGEARNLVDTFRYLVEEGSPKELATMGGPEAWAWAPASVVRANSARVLDWMREYYVAPLRDEGWIAAATGSAGLTGEIRAVRSRYDVTGLLASLSLPVYGKVIEAAAQAEVVAAQALAACALERYFIANGRYPESIDALAPDYLQAVPADPMAPELALGYAPDSGRYRIWSVAFDGVDDGGVMVGEEGRDLAKSIRRSTYRGDWVWGYAPPIERDIGADEEPRPRVILPPSR